LFEITDGSNETDVSVLRLLEDEEFAVAASNSFKSACLRAIAAAAVVFVDLLLALSSIRCDDIVGCNVISLLSSSSTSAAADGNDEDAGRGGRCSLPIDGMEEYDDGGGGGSSMTSV